MPRRPWRVPMHRGRQDCRGRRENSDEPTSSRGDRRIERIRALERGGVGARGGHRVYAGMRDTDGRNAAEVAALDILSLTEELDIRGIELDVQSQDSVDAAIAHIVAADGHLDVVIHNAGHMVYGPAEAFTPRPAGHDLRRQRHRHTTSQPGRASALTPSRRKPRGVGVQQQLRRRDTPRTWVHTSRRKPRWTRWRSATLVNSRDGASKRPSSCPAHSPPVPITSPMPAPPLPIAT